MQENQLRIDTQPDEDRSIVYLDRNQKSITVPHSNGLAKCQAQFPDERKNIANHFNQEEWEAHAALYDAWHEAHDAHRGPGSTKPISLF